MVHCRRSQLLKLMLATMFVNILVIFMFSHYQNAKINTNISTVRHNTHTDHAKDICYIPKLDPFHPEVIPYYSTEYTEKCPLKNMVKIFNGNLTLNIKDVEQARFRYIRRIDDFKNNLSQWISLESQLKNGHTVEYPLKEEFVQVEITIGGTAKNEYHAHIIKGDEVKRHEKKLNFALIMMDSVSNANFQRHMKKTYKFLNENPNTFIQKGQAIVGDGTTAQVCAILTGAAEEELPEARRGFPNSSTVDKWPFMFNELHGLGYETLYSEDDALIGTFNYRLYGFKEPPTKRYLRPFWKEADLTMNNAGYSCSQQYHIDYLKRFFNAFSNVNKFGVILFSHLSHNHMNRISVADEDVLSFYNFLSDNKFNNDTVVILFGDHGMRISGFRKTLQGKLEERLPFMSITVPSWFHNRYPNEVQNIKENSERLTSHFDIYSTIKHLVHFPNSESTSCKYGKSLFTKFGHRTCAQVGVPSHWCPCLTYEPVNVTDKAALEVVEKMIESINNLNAKYPDAKRKCSILSLNKILKASRRVPNKDVQHFVSTEKNKKCDSCKAKLDLSSKFKSYIYEIIFSVHPSQGEYEATADCMKKDDGSNVIRVKPGMSRVNEYGDQPKCIMRELPHLRRFCYCVK